MQRKDFSIISSDGLPQIRTTQTENLFPRFTPVRQKLDSGYWFPVTTYGDDSLYFRTGRLRIRLMTIPYGNIGDLVRNEDHL